MNNINMDGLDGGAEFEGLMLEEAMAPMEQFPNWDEVTNDFNKPFQFDNISFLGEDESVSATLARARGMIPEFTNERLVRL
ncbi:hypothetical protein HER10_EVM0002743 [Colletotrichum scovillei]|uniref:uncharacterized protein n=1 Tax=Colletotrichum scovillei TaxID=1209932 RepID=UPI0015C3BB23|nr:uncharacterized protein HER10_EVM0002743 [Colletotrichum scovillei]KAF4782774.1 hypothetical protein HER10_EVM0002743 [Colletotrichum scovillei]